jgi:hypothetical protein
MNSPSPPPVYVPPAPQPPDPFATAQAQQGYNVNSAIAQNMLNNTNQITPYGNINYKETGGRMVGGSPAVADTPATGGYWNGQSWVSTGGTKGHPATEGQWVPQYTATTQLNPLTQSIVDQSLYNARGVGGLETGLINNFGSTQVPQAPNLSWNDVNYQMYGGKGPGYKPLDLSWGEKQKNIYGLERNTLDPYWQQQQQLKDQQLADQGLTPGSQGWGYEQSQFGLNKANAYDKAMLDAQSQASNDLTAQYNAKMQAYQTGSQNMLNQYGARLNQYNAPLNALSSLRSSAQIAQPGIGQTAQTAAASIPAANYAGVAQGNYATGAGIYNNAVNAQQQQYQGQVAQQNQLMGGLFGLGGNLLGAIPGIAPLI